MVAPFLIAPPDAMGAGAQRGALAAQNFVKFEWPGLGKILYSLALLHQLHLD
jgi:hypothetical protein